MLEGMRADFLKVDRISTKVVDIVRRAKQVRARTSAGTDLAADLNPDYRWLKTSGIISPDKWGNLPGGEVFTTPGEVNGTFVIDGVVGDWLCAKFGNLKETPLTIQVKGNRLTEAHSSNRELEDDFWQYTHTDENSDRVGEFAIGTNIELKDRDRADSAGREISGQCTSPSAIPTARTPARTGTRPRTLMSWEGSSTSGWTAAQIMRNGQFLLEA